MSAPTASAISSSARSRYLFDDAAVVQPAAGQHVVTERLLAQHVQHPVVDAAALPVPGRGEAVTIGARGSRPARPTAESGIGP